MDIYPKVTGKAWEKAQTLSSFTKVSWRSQIGWSSRQLGVKAWKEKVHLKLPMCTHYPSTDPPTVTITSRPTPGRNRIFKCLAYDFYPQGISLHWNQAGKMPASESRGVFPSGNGTYLSWVEVEVPAQDRDPYFCHVEHSGLSQSLSVQWDEAKRAKAESKVATRPQ